MHPDAASGDLGQAAGQLADRQVARTVEVTAGVLVGGADVEDDLAAAGCRHPGEGHAVVPAAGQPGADDVQAADGSAGGPADADPGELELGLADLVAGLAE